MKISEIQVFTELHRYKTSLKELIPHCKNQLIDSGFSTKMQSGAQVSHITNAAFILQVKNEFHHIYAQPGLIAQGHLFKQISVKKDCTIRYKHFSFQISPDYRAGIDPDRP